MTVRLFMVLTYSLIGWGLFTWSLIDGKRRSTLITYAIWFELLSIVKILGAIALHVGAYPLWNNR